MRRPSAEHFRELETEIWDGIADDDDESDQIDVRAILIDPVVNVMAGATKGIEKSAETLTVLADRMAGTNDEVSRVAKASTAALGAVVEAFDAAGLKAAIETVSQDNGKMQKTMTAMLNEIVALCARMKTMGETMQRIEAAQTAPKMLVFDKNGRAIGVRSA